MLIVAEASEGLRFHLDLAPLERPPVWTMGPEGRVWAFGYGCGLERLRPLGLDPERFRQTPDSLDETALPRPVETWTWRRGQSWEQADPSEAPIADRFELPEPCRSFAPPVERSDLQPFSAPHEPDESPSPSLQLAVDARGDLFILRESVGPRFSLSNSRVLRGQLFRTSDGQSLEEVLLPEGTPTRALASRGDGVLVLAGPEGLVEGHPDEGFRSVSGPVRDLDPGASWRLAVSRSEDRFEALLQLQRPPPEASSATTALALYQIAPPDPPRLLTEQRWDREIEAKWPRGVAFSEPGVGWALGMAADDSVLRVEGGQAELRTMNAVFSSFPIELAAHPSAGVLALGSGSELFLLPPGGDGPWTRFRPSSISRDLLALGQVGGVPVAALDSRDEQVFFVHLRPEGACSSPDTLPFRARRVARLVDNRQLGRLFAVQAESDATWWFATASGRTIEVGRATLRGQPGACTQPAEPR